MEVNIRHRLDLLDVELAFEEGGRHNDLVPILKLLQGVGQVRALPGVTRGKLGHQTVHQLAEYLGVHVLQVVLVTRQLWTLIG